jgi:hypothetical protein
MTQGIIHYGLHFGLPAVVAIVFFRPKFGRAYALMMLGMLIDLDHLVANPVFDPYRCSINFHPLHSYWAIALYVLLCLPKRTRLIGIGLVIHILADTVDCLWMQI